MFLGLKTVGIFMRYNIFKNEDCLTHRFQTIEKRLFSRVVSITICFPAAPLSAYPAAKVSNVVKIDSHVF